MVAVPAVRNPILEAVLPGLAFARLCRIRAVAEQCLFVAVLQRVQQLAVLHFDRGQCRRMNDGLPLRLYANMPFDSEMPFVVLAGRTHLGISCLASVLLVHRRGQQGRLHDRARFEHQPMRVSVRIHSCQDLLRQPMFFQEMTKPTDAALIRNHSAKTVKAQKGLKTETVI